MSGQRYVPSSDQRYPPSDDSRFTQRDRSPTRFGTDRFSSNAPPYRGGYQGRSDPSRESNASSVNRDVPRGPRASFDAPRGRGSFSASAPRGRGFPPRGEFRGGFRSSDASRPTRDSDSWPEDPDRSWRDRQFDSRERRPSPGNRARQPEFRDFRDTPNSSSQRENDFSRPRGPSRESSYVSASATDSRRESFSQGGRPYLGAGRGRPDWDARSRDRDRFSDERPFRNRSRSPFRDHRRDQENVRNRSDADTRDDRRHDGRDRSLERDDRDRSYDRYGRPRSPIGNDTFRPSPSSTAPSTPRPISPGGSGLGGSNRASIDVDRDNSSLRRTSSANIAAERRQSFRQSSYQARPYIAKDLQDSRASSPPQAPEVPAFGSLPLAPVTNWNVWKSSNDNKPSQPAAASSSSSSAPGGLKANNASDSKARSVLDIQPPTAPKAERAAVAQDKIPPPRTEVRDQSNPPSPNQTSPIVSPVLHAPSGPRTSPSFAPSQKTENIPTGPRADRIPRGPSTSTVSNTSWQWQRPTATNQPDKSALVTPAKRNFSGDDRWRDETETRAYRSFRSGSISENQDLGSYNRDGTKSSLEQAPSKQPNSAWLNGREPNANAKNHPGPADANVLDGTVPGRTTSDEYLHDDSMELDEDDFEKQEQKFRREKSRLESELIDLDSRHLRGSTPLEQLAILQSIALVDIPLRSAGKSSSKDQGIFGTGQLLTPKAEAIDSDNLSPVDGLYSKEPQPVESPELKALPYLHQGPPTPLEDLELYKLNIDHYRSLGERLTGFLEQSLMGKTSYENVLRAEYAQIYLPWIARVEQLDSENKADTPVEEEIDPAAQMPPLEATPSITTATSEGRRRGGIVNTEYDMERILQESLETANREQAKRMKHELSAKFDPEKEATGRQLEDSNERERHHFVDKTSEISPAQALSVWNFRPPMDRFTDDDHEILVHKFWDYPKKWGKLAQELDHRYTYKDCINHYYATKWNKEFKEKRDKRKQRKGKLKGAQGMSVRPKANALISNLGDVRTELYEGDEFGHQNIAMTDRGRPRRAAAPTFGEKESEDQTLPTTTPARRGQKNTDSHDESVERSGRRGRGTGLRERGSRKSRGQTSLRARSSSPEKVDHAAGKRPVMEPRDAGEPQGRDSDFGSNPAMRPVAPGPSSRQSQSALQGAAPDAKDAAPTQTQRTGPSSYWSVQEVSAFRNYLEHYGSDWQAIASKMGTKTQTMVKNYYFRLLNQNGGAAHPELTEIVERADQRRQREGGIPVEKTSHAVRARPRPVAAAVGRDRRDVEVEGEMTDPILTDNQRRVVGPSDSPYGSPRATVSSTFRPDYDREVPRRAFHQTEAGYDPVSLPQHPQIRPDIPRTVLQYEDQDRPSRAPASEHAHSRHTSDAAMHNIQPAPGHPPSSATYRPRSPPQSMPQLQPSSAASRPPFSNGRSIVEEMYAEMKPPTGERFARVNTATNTQSVTNPVSWLSGVRSDSPHRDFRHAANLGPPPTNQSPAPKPEPRKVSSLAAILNADDEPRRSSQQPATNQPSQLRTVTPPTAALPPQRHPAAVERHQQYPDPQSMTSSRPKPSFSRQTSLHSPPLLPRSSGEPQPPSHRVPQTGWQSPPNFPSLSAPQGPATHQPSSLGYDRRPAGSPPPASEYGRQPLPALNSRPVSSPPLMGMSFNNPSQHYRQSLQENQRPRPLSPPQNERSMAAPQSSLRTHYAGSDRSPPHMRQQQSYGAYQGSSGHSHAIDVDSHRRDSGDMSGRSGYKESSGRYGSRYQGENSPPASQERESQMRSSQRPDAFLIHGSGNYRSGGTSSSSHHTLNRQPRQQTDPDRRTNDQGHGGHGQGNQGYTGRRN